ncbi:MAG: DUF1254 domain-containing protein [Akkermansiaceae bacterium]|nr:DUF1254 domain-containing protein [Akkermansiaceae bacterium]
MQGARSAAQNGTNTNAAPTLLDIVEAYLYGYPLVLLDQTRASFVCQPDASINTLYQVREPPDDTFDTIVRPNVDTLYSSAFLDLEAGPVVLTVPLTDRRYQLVALFDAWSNNFASPRARAASSSSCAASSTPRQRV